MTDAISMILTHRAPPPAADAPDAEAEFEALLLHLVLKTATRPLGGPSPFDGGSAGRMGRDLFLEEVARLAAREDGIGLARSIRAQGEAAAP